MKTATRPGRPPAVVVLGCALALLHASGAAAAPVRIDLTGEVSATDVSTLFPGDPVTIALFVDSGTADEDAAANLYFATGPGNVVYQFAANTPGTADIVSVSADAVAGEWSAELLTTDPGFALPVDISLGGSGPTPDQILPDFAPLTSGTAHFDLSITPFGSFIDVDLTAVEIQPLPRAGIPVPATSAEGSGILVLLLFGSASAAMRGRSLRTGRGVDTAGARPMGARPAAQIAV